MATAENYTDILPQDAILMSGLRVISYMRQDGQIGFKMSQTGDVSAAQLIGLLELAKHRLCSVGMEST